MNSNDADKIKDELREAKDEMMEAKKLLEEQLPAKKKTPGKSYYEDNPVGTI